MFLRGSLRENTRIPETDSGAGFYFLNKMRKIGKIQSDREIKIFLRGRLSQRTPIGTGQGTRKILNELRQGKTVLFENPDCFRQLRLVIEMIERLALHQEKEIVFPNKKIQAYLEKIYFPAHYQMKRRQNPPYLVMKKHLEDWFDALKTRQFIRTCKIRIIMECPLTDSEMHFFFNVKMNPKAIIKECSKQIFGSR